MGILWILSKRLACAVAGLEEPFSRYSGRVKSPIPGLIGELRVVGLSADWQLGWQDDPELNK